MFSFSYIFSLRKSILLDGTTSMVIILLWFDKNLTNIYIFFRINFILIFLILIFMYFPSTLKFLLLIPKSKLFRFDFISFKPQTVKKKKLNIFNFAVPIFSLQATTSQQTSHSFPDSIHYLSARPSGNLRR